LSQTLQSGFRSAGDVEDLALRVTGGGKHKRAGHIFHIDEVHGLAAVTKNDRRLAAGNSFHPAHEDFGVRAMDVHPWAVHVKGPQRDVAQPIHVPKRGQQSFIKNFGGPVDGGVVVGVVILGGRKPFRHPVDRRRRCGRDTSDFRAHRGFQNVERAVGHDLERQPWLLGTLRQPDRCQMKDDVDPFHGPAQRVPVPNIALHQ